MIKILGELNRQLKLEPLRKKIEPKVSYIKLKYNFYEFLAIKEVSSLTGIMIGVIIFQKVSIFILIFALIGFFLPDIWLNDQCKKKKNKFLKSFPDVLDLLTACVEAGLSFDGAIKKIIEKSKENPIKGEFGQYLYEVKIGKSRKDALKDTAKRIGIPEFTSFISTVIQSERLGTGLAGTLRMQSNEIRVRRRQRVEKLALEAPVKLLFPLVFFIFPTTFLVIFGPILLRLIHGF